MRVLISSTVKHFFVTGNSNYAGNNLPAQKAYATKCLTKHGTQQTWGDKVLAIVNADDFAVLTAEGTKAEVKAHFEALGYTACHGKRD